MGRHEIREDFRSHRAVERKGAAAPAGGCESLCREERAMAGTLRGMRREVVICFSRQRPPALCGRVDPEAIGVETIAEALSPTLTPPHKGQGSVTHHA